MCTNEGCSICPCDPNEVPTQLLVDDEQEYGWISGEHGEGGGRRKQSDNLGKISHDNEINSIKTGILLILLITISPP